MGSYHSIAKIGEAILTVLKDARPPGFDEAQFALYQAKDFQSPMQEGVSLYLYRVTPSSTRRHLPSRVDSLGRKHRPPLPLDLYYMLTPWARTAEKQHLILGWCLRALEDTPSLPASLLNQAGAQPDAFYPDETVDLVLDQIPLADLYDIWQFSLQHMQVSVSYIARTVAIDSALELNEYAPVQTRSFGAGKPI